MWWVGSAPGKTGPETVSYVADQRAAYANGAAS